MENLKPLEQILRKLLIPIKGALGEKLYSHRSYEKLWNGTPAVTSTENSIDKSSSMKQSTESTENSDSNYMAPSSILRKVIILIKPLRGEVRLENCEKPWKSEKRGSKSGAETQMLQSYKDGLNLKRKMIENMGASKENFKECISKVNKTIEGILKAIT